MDSNQIALIIPMVVSTAMFAMIFGIFYLRNREKMAMIERGMDPRLKTEKTINRNYVLTWGLLLIGSGLGLFLAYILDCTLLFSKGEDNPAPYFALIAIFGGAGLFTSYLIEKKDNNKEAGE
ncbi:DUF6249 domain-containing protein [Mucilaginibacter sp. UR6-11]|uniref:DUF6249 domain-containing protein n=1 Tax=Mucilaginibacter sp. UR6-11 TaxID=1435644 RepID=UPI001E46C1CE|nr:DUF6249 domain-containing protein [Mucilaginibacter sp. UR6-11]MCC8427280.1 hypothetical protein [Mucilaginibacter sp. UR6-11]